VTSVLVADDHGIVREGLRRLLEAEEGFTVCS
jgi:DNA-binding NarL/FixJ family response regulator